MKKHKWIAVALLLVLAFAGFFKDEFTPDYRNTPAASFLDPSLLSGSRLDTLASHTIFWIMAFGYSLVFVALPTLIIHAAFGNRQFTRFTLWLHIALVVILYIAILINIRLVDVILVSKVNRYLHSPIITLFLWAAFTIGNRQKKNEQAD